MLTAILTAVCWPEVDPFDALLPLVPCGVAAEAHGRLLPCALRYLSLSPAEVLEGLKCVPVQTVGDKSYTAFTGRYPFEFWLASAALARAQPATGKTGAAGADAAPQQRWSAALQAGGRKIAQEATLRLLRSFSFRLLALDAALHAARPASAPQSAALARELERGVLQVAELARLHCRALGALAPLLGAEELDRSLTEVCGAVAAVDRVALHSGRLTPRTAACLRAAGVAACTALAALAPCAKGRLSLPAEYAKMVQAVEG